MRIIIPFLLFALAVLGGSTRQISVYYDGKVYSHRLDVSDSQNAVAWGSFEDTLFDIGFGKLFVHTNPQQPDEVQMHAAGYMEGFLTASHIYNHKMNVFEFETWRYLNASDFSPEIYRFVEKTRLFLVDNIQQHKATDDYWGQMAAMYAQFEGLVEGYNLANPEHPMDTATMFMFESVGDLLDLYHGNLTKGMSLEEKIDFWSTANHCSGLIKLLPDNKELYVSQAAWFFYGAMNRILKHYDIPLQHPATATKELTMSSYPGLLYSFDDFYVMSSGLSVIETTFSIFNESLFEALTTHSVLEWLRVMVANRMAHNGKEWAETFGRLNSGSYNNQYLIVDYKKFTPGKAPEPDTLWVLEQYPGGYVAKDRTAVLIEKQYYASYNVPSLDEVYNICGYPEAVSVDEHAAFWSDRDKCGRANIFRRNHTMISDLEGMKAIMRYNDYLHDPLSKDPLFGIDPGAAPAARYDLRPGPTPKGLAFGEMDTKITSSNMLPHLSFVAISGPTTQHNKELPVFDFATTQFQVPHRGIPDRWDFDWVVFHPQSNGVGIGMLISLIIGLIVSLILATYAIVLCIRRRREKKALEYARLPEKDPSIQA